MLALPIFPGRRQPSIVGRSELNFRVRDGNGWTLALISTNLLVVKLAHAVSVNAENFASLASSSPSSANASLVCLRSGERRSIVIRFLPENKLYYIVLTLVCQHLFGRSTNEISNAFEKAACSRSFLQRGDPYRIRTDVNGVRGRCLNHLTNGPWCTFTDSNRGPTD